MEYRQDKNLQVQCRKKAEQKRNYNFRKNPLSQPGQKKTVAGEKN